MLLHVYINGGVTALPFANLGPDTIKSLMYAAMTRVQKRGLQENLELRFSSGIESLAFFRHKFITLCGLLTGVFRYTPWEIAPFEELGRPPIVDLFSSQNRPTRF